MDSDERPDQDSPPTGLGEGNPEDPGGAQSDAAPAEDDEADRRIGRTFSRPDVRE